MTEKPSAYRDAGVDIDAKYQAVQGSGEAIRSTYGPGVLGDVGLFGGLFDPKAAGADGELLVASNDGVGTKVMIAQRSGDLSTVGEDLVNHCVDDILVQGARPLFFLDYIAMEKMQPQAVQQIIAGLAKACRENGCALIGGETAEMPGVYRPGEVDIAGTIVGAVARDRVLDGKRISLGDRILALPSSGLHTNGFSLARKVLADAGNPSLDECPPELQGQSLAQALLAVHRSYLKPIMPLLDKDLVRGMAHITGGGLLDNVPRVLPEDLAVEITVGGMPRPAIFDYLVKRGGISAEESYRVFNMGFGMVLFVAPADASQVLRDLENAGEVAMD
ncbi:MAG: phosphoribosylformylglycinamidine cyclo-ligase, partial [Planctomycetota bacterium]